MPSHAVSQKMAKRAGATAHYMHACRFTPRLTAQIVSSQNICYCLSTVRAAHPLPSTTAATRAEHTWVSNLNHLPEPGIPSLGATGHRKLGCHCSTVAGTCKRSQSNRPNALIVTTAAEAMHTRPLFLPRPRSVLPSNFSIERSEAVRAASTHPAKKQRSGIFLRLLTDMAQLTTADRQPSGISPQLNRMRLLPAFCVALLPLRSRDNYL